MCEVARYAYLRNDNETALYWLKEIVRLSKRQKVSEYEKALERLVRIYDNTGNTLMARKYQQLLDSEINKKTKEILENYLNSESDFYKLVLSLKEGIYGFSKDKERAIKLMKEGIEKGYHSLYRMYSDYLYEQGDDRYFAYLLEDIKDTEKKLTEEFTSLLSSHNKETAIYILRVHSRSWLTERYRLAAEAYIKGYGTTQNLKVAEKYLWKAMQGEDRETIFLLARLYNGEFDIRYRDYDISINRLKSLHLEHENNKYPYALLGDAYIGKSWRYFFKARQCYEKYPDISKYKSALRNKYCLIRKIIYILIFLIVFVLCFILVYSKM